MSSEPQAATPTEPPPYDVISIADRPERLDAHQTFGGAAWPEFLLHDPVAIAHWETMMRYFPEYQLSLVSDDEIIAVINSVPLHFDAPPEDLPDRGVDWGVEKSVQDYETGIEPNCLMGMQIVVGKAYRNRGLSSASAIEMNKLAGARGLEAVILPVRPTRKHRYPLIPMETYVTWSNDAGLPYDGWLRVHARLGGQIGRVCSRSMIIPGSIKDWSDWTKLEFPGSGDYIVPGALNPIKIDIENDFGEYREPNVWIVHQIA